jgi:uncharacterized protein DUF2064
MTPPLAIFLEASRLGAVKPRLALKSARHALRLYRVLAARTLTAARAACLESIIWYSPLDARTEMQFWLGDSWNFRPQMPGDLGARLAGAAHAVPRGHTWVAIGAPHCGTWGCPRRGTLDLILRRPAYSPALICEAGDCTMAWRVLEHADQRWNVSIAAERRPNSPDWNLVFSFRGTDPAQRSVWATYPMSSSSKSALFAKAERISNDDLISLLVERLG